MYLCCQYKNNVRTRMKILNSHYIALPEPHRIIMSSKTHDVGIQIGVLSVVEEQPTVGGAYGIVTHKHPVVKSLGHIGFIESNDGRINTFFSMSRADGDIWTDVEIFDCFMLCDADKREIALPVFNSILIQSFTNGDADYDPVSLFKCLREEGIDVKLTDNAKQDHQQIILTPMEYGDKMYLMSYFSQLPFAVPFGDVVDDEQMRLYDENEVFFEFVNQARALVALNPKYDFKFLIPDNRLEHLMDRLNTELNNYLEREDGCE